MATNAGVLVHPKPVSAALSSRDQPWLRSCKRRTPAKFDSVADVIPILYASILEDAPWRSFLRALTELAGCDNAAIVLRLSRSGSSPLIVWGERPSVRTGNPRDIIMEHARLGEMDPLRNSLVKPGDIRTLSEILSCRELRSNEFYTNVMRHFGIEYEIGMYISAPGGWECNIGLVNGAENCDFGAFERGMLVELLPHLETALKAFARMQRSEVEKQVLYDTLDRLSIATFVLDAQGHILSMNGFAHALADEREIIHVVDRKIVLNRLDKRQAFQAMLNEALSCSDDRYSGALRLEDAESRATSLLIKSVSPRFPRAGSTPSAIVYATGQNETHAPEDIIGEIFGLSHSESLLAAQLAQGFSLVEAAGRLGLTENTVRSYAKSIFSKTGVTRQAELVRLILKSVAVLV